MHLMEETPVVSERNLPMLNEVEGVTVSTRALFSMGPSSGRRGFC